MKKILTFKQHINESAKIKQHPMLSHVITEEEAGKLFSLEEDNLGPDDAISDEDFEKFKKDVTGMTMKQYCEWRWPDEPQEQFDMALAVLDGTNESVVNEDTTLLPDVSDDRIGSVWDSAIGGNRPAMDKMRKDILDLMKRDEISFPEMEAEL